MSGLPVTSPVIYVNSSSLGFEPESWKCEDGFGHDSFDQLTGFYNVINEEQQEKRGGGGGRRGSEGRREWEEECIRQEGDGDWDEEGEEVEESSDIEKEETSANTSTSDDKRPPSAFRNKLTYHERQFKFWAIKWRTNSRLKPVDNFARRFRYKWAPPRRLWAAKKYRRAHYLVSFKTRRRNLQRKWKKRFCNCFSFSRKVVRTCSHKLGVRARALALCRRIRGRDLLPRRRNSHASQTSSWLPPLENWSTGLGGTLPYGWESAIDKEGKTYFINHLSKTTSYDDPRSELLLQEEPPQPRNVDLSRDPDMGFGFVAGSEKPVIVRFVTDGGPSVEKLLPGDQILMINGEDVKRAPRDHVIQLVRSCKEKVTLTVCQPPLDNSARKSALLSAAKKQRLKSHPSRVRFAESVDINGSTSLSPSQISSSESTTPFMPNVLKVFLENGQTKSFKYDTSTTVGDVLESLHQKLGIKCQEHFSLVVEHVKSLRRNKLTILDPQETLTKIAARPGAQHLRCLYRITFVPRDAYDLLRKDSVAFEYLFLQCCNDVIQERFSPELKYDVALRLAALHIHQHSSSSSTTAKISLKSIERECGLDRFVPGSLVESMKRKELRKLLSHFLKLHGSLTAPGQKQMTALQAKLHYLKIISELPSYGAKCFSTNVMEGNAESVMLISPRFGISQITGIRNSMPEPICEIEQVISVAATREEDDLSVKIEIGLKHPDKENLIVSLEDRDAEELILVLQGYYKLLTEKSLAVQRAKEPVRSEQVSTTVPPYHSFHQVETTPWSYIDSGEESETQQRFPKVVDLSSAPPYQHIPDGYKIPNGNIPRFNESESPNSYGGCLRLPMLDSNMNKTVSVYENSSDGTYTQANFDVSFSASLSSSGTDKSLPNAQPNVALPHPPSADVSRKNEIRSNNEVRSHVAEMRQMVEDAETYLSDPEGEVTDAESVRSESYGKLKHSDSLLLLTQGQKIMAKVNVTESEKSESDTDSQTTPQNSPAHKLLDSSPPSRPSSIVKTSGSSFGLHSPDNLPMDLQNPENNIKALIRQLEDNSGLPYTFAEGTLYLDPDIIDLTMIPPPITPDEDGAKMLPSQLSTPPTPFADRESLDQELKALERDVGDLRMLTNTSWADTGTLQSLSESSTAGASDTEDTMSLSSMSTTTNDSLQRASHLASLLKRNGSNGGPGFTLAALRQLGIHLGEGEDIDSFIANLTIPPPPEGSVALQLYKDVRKMGEYDINDYIIPPPPSNSASDNRSSDIIRRLYEAKEGISRVVGGTDTEWVEKDTDIDEVKVFTEQVQKGPLQGRVASLQKQFECANFGPFAGQNGNSSPEAKQKALKYNKNKLNLVKELAGQNNSRVLNSTRVPREMDARLAEALAENAKMFNSFNSTPNYSFEPENCEIKNNVDNSPPVSSRIRSYSHVSTNETENSKQANQTSPKRESETPMIRSPSERKQNFKHSNTIEGETPSSLYKTNNGSLSKSASHGDIAIHGQISKHLSPIKSNKSSLSNEDLRQANWHDSKQSITSSNDSLTSSSSVATVKSVSIKSLDEEDPPKLPPRNNVKTTNLKPPLPRNSAQDNVKILPVVKGIRTPSPIRKSRRTPSPEVGDKPPAIPLRIRKSLSPSPTNTLPLPQRSRALQKSPAPSPSKSENIVNSYNNSTLPKKFHVSGEECKPILPSKAVQNQNKKHSSTISVKSTQYVSENGITIKNNYNQEPPLHTSSPKLPPKVKIANGKFSSNDLDDSLDSGSFDQDSLEETEEVEAMLPASRAAYRHTASVVSESLKRLTEMVATCSKLHQEGDNSTKNEEQFQKVKDSLTSESRQFVTASKLFVKSATECEDVLLSSLSKCVTILQRMVDLSRLVVQVTSTPLQTQNIVLKVRDVVAAYLSTVRAALSASGRGMDHPSMNTLMTQATNLAGVLTALMRTLKVFTP